VKVGWLKWGRGKMEGEEKEEGETKNRISQRGHREKRHQEGKKGKTLRVKVGGLKKYQKREEGQRGRRVEGGGDHTP
jgi:hypothetical protein